MFRSEIRLLHIAPEWCLARALRSVPTIDYLSADLESPLAMDHVDLLDLPYKAGCFDVVICSHVLEHVEDDLRGLREIRRVLRHDGRAILMAPIDDACEHTIEDPSVTSNERRHRVYGQADHLRRYGRDFCARVAGQGFDVEAVRYIDQLDANQVEREGLRRSGDLFQYDDVFVCRPAARRNT